MLGDDAAVGQRFSRPETEHDHRRRILLVQPLYHARHRLAGDQGHVPIKDQNIALETGQGDLGLADGMGGTKLVGLHRYCQAERRREGLDLLASGAGHDHGARSPERGDRIGEMAEHRPARNRVEHLVQRGFHTRALAGGKDDGGKGRIGHEAGLCHVPLAQTISKGMGRAMGQIPFDIVVFDLDGTLADTAPDLTAALNHALGELGRPPIPAEDVRRMVGHGVRALLRRGLAATGGASEALIDQGFPLFITYYEAHIADHTRPFEGVETALAALAAQGIKLAICTNKLEGLTHELIAALGWQGRFTAIVGGDTLPRQKPDPAPVREAITRAGGGRAAFVGDSISDTDAARAAGIPCIALTFGFSDRPPRELGATALIDHFDELLPALGRLG
jgi:phosphoglycolate phosphatase